MNDVAPALTVGITTRNRPDDLLRCLLSLEQLSPLSYEVIVVDDASDVPAGEQLATKLPPAISQRLRILRQEKNEGLIVARNLIAREGRAPYVLSLDDDAFLLDRAAVSAALEVLENDATVAVVALAQTNALGVPHDPAIQPAPVNYPCVVPTFFGYGHLMRRRLFLSMGGYRELFTFFHEEKELCKRLLDANWKVVFLPHARVAHVFSPHARGKLIHVRYGARNGCLDAVYNEPWWLMCCTVPFRLLQYHRQERYFRDFLKSDEPPGFGWVVSELVRQIPKAWKDRQPLRYQTYRRWRSLRKSFPKYQLPTGPSHAPLR
jgi:GT2 family glycosyltransferase